MDRYKILVCNLVIEIYDKIFDCNLKDTVYYLKTEIGFSDTELLEIIPDALREYTVEEVKALL